MQFWCAIFLFFLSVQAYRQGDLVRGWQKTQTTEWASKEWTEIQGKYCPKYLYKRTAPLPIFRSDQSIPEGDVKMSFAFDEMKFITPFILVYSENRILEFIEFTFIYSGDDIVEFKYKTHYSDEDENNEQKKRKNTISIIYLFEESTEKDITVGMGIFLFLGFGMSLVVLFTVFIDLIWKSQEYAYKLKYERKMEKQKKINEREDYALPPSSSQTFVEKTDSKENILQNSENIENRNSFVASNSNKGKDD